MMQKIYKRLLLTYIITLIILELFHYLSSGKYDMYIVNGNYKHAVITDGTFVVFGTKPEEEIEQYDVIKTKEDKLARIMDIKEDSYNIVYDDFDDESFDINKTEYVSSLLFHLNEIGNLYEDYLKEYKDIFMAIPFILLSISFIFNILFRKQIDNENMEFEYHELIIKSYDKNNNITYSNFTGNPMELYYDNSVKSQGMPDFKLDAQIESAGT